MPEVIVKVGDLKKPDPGKKRYKLITPDNIVYQVNSDMVHLIRLEKSYKIFFEEQEYNGFKFRLITRAPEEVPEISTGADAGQRQVPLSANSRPKTAKEDEEQINKRHRLNWVGERMDALCPGHALTYADLRPVAEVFEQLYDAIAEGVRVQKEYPEGYKTPAAPGRANAYKPGYPAKDDSDLDDDIPF